MSFYYLELNAIVNLGKNILLLRDTRHVVYTSVWAIDELLISLSEKTYSTARSRIETLLASGVRIDWEDPMFKIFSAFKIFHRSLNVSSVFQEIVQAITGTESLSELEKRHPNVWREIDTYKEARNISLNFTSGLNSFFVTARDQLVQRQLLEGNFEQFYLGNLARYIAEKTNLDHNRVISWYNGKLHWYISMLKMVAVNMEELGKNDDFDIWHTVYIQNSLTYIVSHDGIFQRLGYPRVLNHWQFMKAVGIEV